MNVNAITGKLRDFPNLFFPVLLMTFSTCVYLMVEKVLLGNFSTLAMEAAVAVAFIVQVFQVSTAALAMMAIVFVARWNGAKNYRAIGPCIWQYIWFSILSTLVTIPIGIVLGKNYLAGMPFEEIATPYLYFLLAINGLYPLATALSCFYIGQGKTKLVLIATIVSQLFKIILAYWLISTWGLQDPSLCLFGGAISTFLSQILFCVTLFWSFIHPKNKEKYASHHFRFQPKLFWESIHPGLLRAMNRILTTTSWVSICYLMSNKSETHLLVLSIGSTFFFLLPFLSDAIGQAQTVIVSQLIGSHNYFFLRQALRSGFLWCSIWIILVGIPLLVFPVPIFSFLFPNITLDPSTIKRILLGLWSSFTFFTLLYVPLGYILAFKDMYFSFFMGGFNWINGFLLMYIAIKKVNIAPENFWLVACLMHGTTALIYYFRARILCSRVEATPALSQ